MSVAKTFCRLHGFCPLKGGVRSGWGRRQLLGTWGQKHLVRKPSIHMCSYDRAGHDRSEPTRGPYNIEEELDALHYVLGNYEIWENIVLVGTSYGGVMICSFAAKFLAGIIGLVYVNPNSIYFFEKHPEIIRKLTKSKVPILANVAPGWLVRSIVRKQLGLGCIPRISYVSAKNHYQSLGMSRKHHGIVVEKTVTPPRLSPQKRTEGEEL